MKKVCLSGKMDEYQNLSKFALFNELGSTNRAEMDVLGRMVMRVYKNELTPLERVFVMRCLINGEKQTDVAADLGVTRSAVCHGVSRAKKRIQKTLSYALVE